MRHDDILQIQNLFESAVAQGTAMASYFFRRLGESEPALVSPSNEIDQFLAVRFMVTAATVVSELGNPHRVAPLLAGLAREYCRPHALSNDLASVCAALTWAVERTLGAAFTPDLRKAWMEGCETLVGEMFKPAQSPDLSESAGAPASMWLEPELNCFK